MALAPIHLPAGPRTGSSGITGAGTVQRPRRRVLPSRRFRLEPLTARDALGSPSDVSLRSVGEFHHMHR